MKKVFMGLGILIFVITACAPVTPAPQPSFIVEQPSDSKPTSTPVPVNEEASLSPVEEAVVKQLAGNLGLKASDISVVSNEKVEFGDACLGVSMPEVMCAQVITPGRVIILDSNGVQYEYHTSEDGSRIQPAALALTWKREGGFAGFCDSLTVFLSGEVYGNKCNASDGKMETFADLLSVAESKQFAAWIVEYGQVEIDASDPKGVADGMTVILSLTGQGDQQTVSDADRQKLLEFAQELYQELYK